MINNKRYKNGECGYECIRCRKIVPSMMGDYCNDCRITEERHIELIQSLKQNNNTITVKPYIPDFPKDSAWYAVAVVIGTIFAVIMILIIFGCSNPVNNDNRDGLVIQRPCSDCHIVIDGKIQKPKIKPIAKYGYETLTCDTIEGK